MISLLGVTVARMCGGRVRGAGLRPRRVAGGLVFDIVGIGVWRTDGFA